MTFLLLINEIRFPFGLLWEMLANWWSRSWALVHLCNLGSKTRFKGFSDSPSSPNPTSISHRWLYNKLSRWAKLPCDYDGIPIPHKTNKQQKQNNLNYQILNIVPRFILEIKLYRSQLSSSWQLRHFSYVFKPVSYKTT